MNIIMNMHDGTTINISSCGGLIGKITFTIGFDQGFVLNPFMVAVVMNELTRDIQIELVLTMLF